VKRAERLDQEGMRDLGKEGEVMIKIVLGCAGAALIASAPMVGGSIPAKQADSVAPPDFPTMGGCHMGKERLVKATCVRSASRAQPMIVPA
jgi:hypothetical protein